MKLSFAQQLLVYFGNTKPSLQQIAVMESLLSSVTIKQHLLFDRRLAKRERECLRLAAAGHNVVATAEILQLSPKTVEQYRQSLKKKLGCKTLIQAVWCGVKYGYLAAQYSDFSE